MCCIYGAIVHPDSPIKTDPAALALFRGIFAKSFGNIEGRGRDASGFFAIHENKKWQLIKAPIRSSEFIYYKQWRAMLDKAFTPDMTMIIGHARAKTQGSEQNNLNNHPIEYKSLVGVHNGSISNDDEVFEKLGCERFGEVDSEAIFAAIHEMCEKPDEWKEEEIQAACNMLSGSAAVLTVSKNDPNKLLIIREKNPIDLIYFNDLGILFLCSDKDYVLKTVSDLRGMVDFFDYQPDSKLFKVEKPEIVSLGMAVEIDRAKMVGKKVSDFNDYAEGFKIDFPTTTRTGYYNERNAYRTGGETCTECGDETYCKHYIAGKLVCYQCWNKNQREEARKPRSNTTKTETKKDETEERRKVFKDEEINAVIEVADTVAKYIMDQQREKGLGKKWHRSFLEKDMLPPITQAQFEEHKFNFRGEKDGLGKERDGDQGLAYEVGFAQGAWWGIYHGARMLLDAGKAEANKK